jgi:hypothetical protein
VVGGKLSEVNVNTAQTFLVDEDDRFAIYLRDEAMERAVLVIGDAIAPWVVHSPLIRGRDRTMDGASCVANGDAMR